MTDDTATTSSLEYAPLWLENYIPVGTPVWVRVEVPGGMVVYGENGDVIYRGYWMTGSVTFLVFDQVSGSGRKATVKTFAINAQHCLFFGPYSDTQEIPLIEDTRSKKK